MFLREKIMRITGIIMAFVVLFSAFFLLAEAGHHCHEEECPICACMQACENMLQRFSLGIAVACVFTLVLSSYFILEASKETEIVSETLVGRKIRLND